MQAVATVAAIVGALFLLKQNKISLPALPRPVAAGRGRAGDAGRRSSTAREQSESPEPGLRAATAAVDTLDDAIGSSEASAKALEKQMASGGLGDGTGDPEQRPPARPPAKAPAQSRGNASSSFRSGSITPKGSSAKGNGSAALRPSGNVSGASPAGSARGEIAANRSRAPNYSAANRSRALPSNRSSTVNRSRVPASARSAASNSTKARQASTPVRSSLVNTTKPPRAARNASQLPRVPSNASRASAVARRNASNISQTPRSPRALKNSTALNASRTRKSGNASGAVQSARTSGNASQASRRPSNRSQATVPGRRAAGNRSRGAQAVRNASRDRTGRIVSYLKRGQPDDIEQALDMFDKALKANEVNATAYIYKLLVGGAVQSKNPEKALELIEEMHRQKWKLSVNLLIGIIRVCNGWRRALEVFEASRPQAMEYVILIRNSTKDIGPEKALVLYHSMRKQGFAPDITSCKYLLRVYERNKQPMQALKLFQDMMESRCEQEEKKAVANASSNTSAAARQKKQPGLKPDAETFNILINACALGGKHAWALSMFEAMVKDERLMPDNRTYSIMARVCKGAKQPEAASQVLSRMRTLRGIPDASAFDKLRSAYEATAEQEDIAMERLADEGKQADAVLEESIGGLSRISAAMLFGLLMGGVTARLLPSLRREAWGAGREPLLAV